MADQSFADFVQQQQATPPQARTSPSSQPQQSFDDFVNPQSNSVASTQSTEAPSNLERYRGGLWDGVIGGLTSMAKSILPKYSSPSEIEAMAKNHRDLISQGKYAEAAKSIASDAFSRIPGGQLIEGMVHNSIDQIHKAGVSADNHDTAGAILHGLSAIPVVGSMAAPGVDAALGSPGEYDKYGNTVQEPVAPDPYRAAGLATSLGLSSPTVLGKVAPIVGKAFAAPANAAGNVLAEVEGRITGVGPQVFKKAFNDPDAVRPQMRIGDAQDVRNHLANAAQDVKDVRANEYAQDLQNLSGKNQPMIDPNPILGDMEKKLNDFRVDRNSDGELDFSRSPVGDAGQADIRKVDSLVQNWNDWTPLGADALKRRIGDLYSDSGQARSLITNIKNSVKNGIVDQVPDYADMTSKYEQSSKFLDDLKDLSLNDKEKGTGIKKITTMLNQSSDYRQTLVDALQQYSGIDHTGEIAGLALNRLAPRGLAGYTSGSGLLAGIAFGTLSPKLAVSLALTSPRLMGELAVGMGTLKKFIQQNPEVVSAAENGPQTDRSRLLAAAPDTSGSIPTTPQPGFEQRVQGQRMLPAASSPVGVSGVIVPDMAGQIQQGVNRLQSGPRQLPPASQPMNGITVPDYTGQAIQGTKQLTGGPPQIEAPQPGQPPTNILPTGPGAIGPAGTTPIHSVEEGIPLPGERGGNLLDIPKPWEQPTPKSSLLERQRNAPTTRTLSNGQNKPYKLYR